MGRHRRKHSSSTLGSAAGAEEEEQAAPTNISTDIDVLFEAARYRTSELRSRNTVADHQLVMEMRTRASGIEKLRSGSSESRTPQAVKLYTTSKTRLIEILNVPSGQTIGSPFLSDQEGLNWAYSINQYL